MQAFYCLTKLNAHPDMHTEPSRFNKTSELKKKSPPQKATADYISNGFKSTIVTLLSCHQLLPYLISRTLVNSSLHLTRGQFDYKDKNLSETRQ
jgi:hypothetical protein